MTSTDTTSPDVLHTQRMCLAADLASALQRRSAEVYPMLQDAPDYGEALANLRMIRQAAETATDLVVMMARDDGLSWELIGQALRISRQAAQQRFTHSAQITRTRRP